MNGSTPGLPVYHQLLESTQTHVHRVGDAIQPSHPPSFPSPPVPNPSQHQGLFQWVNTLHEMAKVLEFQLEHPMNPQDWSPLGWTGWISLQSKALSRVFNTISPSALSFLHSPTLTSIHDHFPVLTRQTFVSRVMSLPFNMLSRLVITFLPRSKHLLISWPQSPSAVILEPRKIKSVTVSTVSASISDEVMRPDAIILVFWILRFKPTFSLSSYTFMKRLFSSSSLSAIRVVSSAYLRWFIFLPAILIPACASSSLAFLSPLVTVI